MPLRRGHITSRERTLGPVRPMTREDLALLNEKREQPAADKFRDSHHMVARLSAAGLSLMDIARRTGYSYNRVHVINADPAFQNLVSHYRGLVDQAFVENVDEYMELATANMLKAERMIADKIDDALNNNEHLPTRDLLAISRDAADRFGYGKKQTNLNVNVDFAAKLEAAVRRSGKAEQMKVISGSGDAPSKSVPAPTVSSQQTPARSPLFEPIRRRA